MRTRWIGALLMLLGCEERAPEFEFWEWDAGALDSEACTTFDPDRVYAKVALRCVDGDLLVPLDTPSYPVPAEHPRCVSDLHGRGVPVIDPLSQRLIYVSSGMREHRPRRIELVKDGSRSYWVVVGREDDEMPAWSDDPRVSRFVLMPDSREFLAHIDAPGLIGWHWSTAPRDHIDFTHAIVKAVLPGKLVFDVNAMDGMALVDEHGVRLPIEGALRNEVILAVRHHAGGLYVATISMKTDLTPVQQRRLWQLHADGSYELVGAYARMPKHHSPRGDEQCALAPTGELFVVTEGVVDRTQSIVRFGAPTSSDEPAILLTLPQASDAVPCLFASGPPKLDQLRFYWGFVTGL